jgi:putative ABC transport system permease protein
MRSLFYPKLALQNIGRNRRFYFPYLLTGILTIAMFYNMCFLTSSKDLSKIPGFDSLKLILVLGTIIVGIFSVVFLVYTNSFLMKRRNKELGLYNILGMEKRHIAWVLFFESVFTGIGTIVIGLAFGMLISKLLLLLLCRMLFFEVDFGFSVSKGAVTTTAILFALTYFATLLFNLMRIRLSKPIELLHGDKAGEKEPRVKWLLVLIGTAALGTGYWMAQTIKSPLEALMWFFVAVILVMIGTYCLFTAGSIALLKLLRKNKIYYYKTKHFTAISGMMYRMKQNAVGLANICILSTMVLVMVSTTVSLYVGVDNALENRYPGDISFTLDMDDTRTTKEKLYDGAMNAAQESGLDVKNLVQYTSLGFAAVMDGSNLKIEGSNYTGSVDNVAQVVVLTGDEYKSVTGKDCSLQKGQVMAYCIKNSYDWDTLTLGGVDYQVQGWLKDFPVEAIYNAYVSEVFYIIVDSQETMDSIYQKQLQVYGDNASSVKWYMQFDLDGTDEEKIKCYENMKKTTSITYEYVGKDDNGHDVTKTGHRSYLECRQVEEQGFYALYGGLLFIGIFLGLLFLMATVLIIYYKQISEGYDDKEHFEIMQKVGMSHGEVRSSIRSQVLTVFFLPLVAAFIHLAFAFKMITKLLSVFGLTDINLFALCTLITIGVFAVVYAVIYAVTARVYYRIVEA